MARGRRWTPAEDRLIRRAAARTREAGIGAYGRHLEVGDYRARLREVSQKLERTYGAVRTRASRIGAHSFGPWDDDG